jgi:hypothetical protein
MDRNFLVTFRGIAAGTVKGVPEFCPLVTILAAPRTPHLHMTVQTVEMIGSFKARFVDVINVPAGLLLAQVKSGERFERVTIRASRIFKYIL